jgi:two-component system chemotaxis response regulator CheV
MNEVEKGILLESGTNELEVIVFTIGANTFGINVIKVREIINPLPITKMPNSHPFIEGIIRLRDEILPVIDLASALGFPPSEHTQLDKYIVAELNQIKVAFHVHTVSRIHRISWGKIEKPTELSNGLEGSTIGVIKMDTQMILLLDYEKVVVDIAPNCGINIGQLKFVEKADRSNKKVISTEDSPVLRSLINDTLGEVGYNNIRFFDDGQAAWDYLNQLKEDYGTSFTEHAHILVTDIEMPRMDGHHLTKKIKDDPVLQAIPVIIFSSLITDDLEHKGNNVGADAQVSKPEIVKLVEAIDELIL